MHEGDGAAQRRSEIRMLTAIVAVHLAIAIPLGIFLNIWIDEAYSLAASTGGLRHVLRQTSDVEMQPPFYFLLLWAWRLIDSSAPFARMLSIVISAGSIVAMHFAARRWLKGISPAWVVAPLALNRYTLYAATEIRPYSLNLLWTAVLLILLYDGYFAERTRQSRRVLYAVAAFCALSTYYYLGFLLPAGAVILALARRWRLLGSYVASMALVGILFLPLFLYASGHVASSSVDEAQLPGFFRSVGLVVVQIFSFPFALSGYPSAIRWTVVAAVAVVAALAGWTHRANLTREARALWLILVTLAVFYIFVARFVMGEEIRPRHMIVVLVPVMFALVAIASSFTTYRNLALTVLATSAVGLSSIASVQAFAPLAKGGDFKRVAAYLEAHEQPHQSIAIVVANAEVPFKYYYRGTSTLVPIPARDTLSSFVPLNWRIESEDQVRAKLNAALSPDGEIWVLTDFLPGQGANPVGTDLHFHYLENVLAKDFTVESRRDFYAGCVRLCKKRGETEVTVAAP